MLISRIRHESGYSTDGSESSGTDFYLNDNLEETLKSSQGMYLTIFPSQGFLICSALGSCRAERIRNPLHGKMVSHF
uniref:Uncharacterized protein n=1 Tax=Magallana gigas TaxID=29159 RepID=K1Q2I8_MAGGI